VVCPVSHLEKLIAETQVTKITFKFKEYIDRYLSIKLCIFYFTLPASECTEFCTFSRKKLQEKRGQGYKGLLKQQVEFGLLKAYIVS